MKTKYTVQRPTHFRSTLLMNCLLFLLLLQSALLQAEETEIQVHYLGHSSFILQFNDSTQVLTDFGNSYCWGLESPIFGIGDFVPLIMTYSHRHDDHYAPARKPEGVAYTLELFDSLDINGLEIRPERTSENNVNVESNTSFIFRYNGFTIVHLGDAQANIMNISDPQQQQLMLEKFPDRIDVLLMTIEGVSQFIPQAEMFIDLLQPRMVIPMHYWTPQYKEDFLSYLELQNDTAGKNYEIYRTGLADHTFLTGDTLFSAMKIFSLDPFPFGDPVIKEGNLAFSCPVNASSVFDANHPCCRATDGYSETGWRSAPNDEEWLMIDLGAPCLADTLIITSKNPATVYDILISNDSIEWVIAYSANNTGLLNDTISLGGMGCRYIMYDAHDRKYNTWGYWIYEFEVYERSTGTSFCQDSSTERWDLGLSVHPNPAKDIISISFSIPFDEKVVIGLYSVSGNQVRSFVNSMQHNGDHYLKLDVSNIREGTYLLVFRYRDFIKGIKIILLH